jgi:hypothetical protein
MHRPNPNCFQLSRKATIREVDVAKLGGGFRWLTPLFSRALYKPKEKHLIRRNNFSRPPVTKYQTGQSCLPVA